LILLVIGTAVVTATAEIDVVDGGGGVVEVLVTNRGEYFLDAGTIDSIEVDAGGVYYRDSGVVESFEITDGGEYHKDDPEAPALVATVTVTVDGGGGAGATFDVTVDDDPESTTFGSLTGITLDDGGDDYTGSEYIRQCCDTALDGRTFVLRRGSGPCARENTPSNEWSSFYNNPSSDGPLSPYAA
jgi:hypothetical protein